MFLLQVSYQQPVVIDGKLNTTWETITSSASHLATILELGTCFSKKVYAIRTQDGNVFDCKTKKWLNNSRRK